MAKLSGFVPGLLAGAAAGALIVALTSTRLDVCHTPGNHSVRVALDASMDCPEVSIRPTNTVSWYSPAGSVLTITPRVANIPVTCQGNVCLSSQPIGYNPIDYDVRVVDGTQSHQGAGRIIIVKP